MNRRHFVKTVGTGFLLNLIPRTPGSLFAAENASKPIRLAFIGVGGRGTYYLQMALNYYPDVQVPVICDIDKKNLCRAIEIVQAVRGNEPQGYSKDELDYQNMLQRDDFDAVFIATSIKWHGKMSVDAMNAGKHVGCEVPACKTLKECHDLVKAKERNKVRYMMFENYVYFKDNLAVLNLVKRGIFGEPYYAECGYIHENKGGQYNADGSLNWRGELMTSDHGNHYPTHSGGPVFKWMGINDGDRLERLTCYATMPNRTAPLFYAGRFGAEKAAKLRWTLGEMTTCLIKTAMGKVVKMDLDIQSNRPHSFYYLLQGTKGIYDKRFGISLNNDSQKTGGLDFKWEDADSMLRQNESLPWKELGDQAQKLGHGGSDYFCLRDFIEMLRHDREPWLDVYDSASWSAIYECSQKSLDDHNASIEIPDYTGGKWRSQNWRKNRLT
jgi:predicted dehydrogenase